jgi:hypothetical protein
MEYTLYQVCGPTFPGKIDIALNNSLKNKKHDYGDGTHQHIQRQNEGDESQVSDSILEGVLEPHVVPELQ